MKKLTILLFTGTLFLTAQAQHAWTLQECIQHALNNNLSVKRGELAVSSSHLTYERNREALLPSVSGFASNNLNFGRTINPVTNSYIQKEVNSNQFSLSSQWVLFSGLQNLNNVKLSSINEQVSKKDLEVITNNISLQVATQFLQILFNEEAIKTVKAGIGATEKQLETARLLFDAGNSNQGAVLEFEAKLASDKLDLVNAENNHRLSLLALANLLQVPFDDGFTIQGPSVVIPDEVITEGTQAIFEKASKVLPEIEAAQLRYRAAMVSRSISKGAHSPTLSFGGNISSLVSDNFKEYLNPQTTYIPFGYVNNVAKEDVYIPSVSYGSIQTKPFSSQLKDNLGKAIGVSMSIPIYSNGRIRTAVKQAEINTELQKLNIKQAENELYTSVANALANYKAARAKFNALAEAVNSQKKNYEFNLLRFESGALNGSDLVVSQRNYEMAEARLLQGKYDVVFRKVLLDFYRGKPLALN